MTFVASLVEETITRNLAQEAELPLGVPRVIDLTVVKCSV